MKNNNITISSLDKTLSTNRYLHVLQNVTICPWCFNQTRVKNNLEENKCEVCKRTITEGDLENELI